MSDVAHSTDLSYLDNNNNKMIVVSVKDQQRAIGWSSRHSFTQCYRWEVQSSDPLLSLSVHVPLTQRQLGGQSIYCGSDRTKKICFLNSEHNFVLCLYMLSQLSDDALYYI